MSSTPEYEIAHGGDEEAEEFYECNSCGEEYEDPAAMCCDDGEVVPVNDI